MVPLILGDPEPYTFLHPYSPFKGTPKFEKQPQIIQSKPKSYDLASAASRYEPHLASCIRGLEFTLGLGFRVLVKEGVGG